MKKAIIYLTMGAFFCGTALFFSCSKSTTTPSGTNDTSTTVATDQSTASNAYEDGTNQSEDQFNNSSYGIQSVGRQNLLAFDGGRTTGSKGIIGFVNTSGDSSYVSVTRKGSLSDSLIVDTFMFQHGPGHDNLKRSGTIICHTAKSFLSPNFKDTISFDYTVNGYHIQGTVYVDRVNHNTLHRVLSGGKVTFPDGSVVNITHREHWRTTTVVPFGNYFAPSQVSIYGTESGISRTGVSFTSNIDQATPLLFNFGAECFIHTRIFPVSGVLTLSSSAWKYSRVINFGSGTCDRIFTVTVGPYSVTTAAN